MTQAEIKMKSKKIDAVSPAKSLVSPLGRTVIMRAAIWGNGKREVAAMVTSVDDASQMELAGAAFIVSVTASPPGTAPCMLQQVPLFDKAPPLGVLPAAWFAPWYELS